MRGYVDDNFSGRDWNLATAMVMNGEAAFQIMGDWAKGEFFAAGKVPGEDFLCASTPGVRAICITSTALQCSRSKAMTRRLVRRFWQS